MSNLDTATAALHDAARYYARALVCVGRLEQRAAKDRLIGCAVVFAVEDHAVQRKAERRDDSPPRQSKGEG